jgi:hypothetical protein
MGIGSHTIPRFYLEQFANPPRRKGKPGIVWVYEKERTPRPSATNAQGYENGYFAYTHTDGRRDESFETKLAKLEARCGDVLVSAKREIFDLSNTSHKNTLGFYAGLLFARSTSRRKFSAGNWAKMRDPLSALISNDEYVHDLAARYTQKSGEVTTERMVRDMLRKQVEKLAQKETADNAFVEDLLAHTEMIKKMLVPNPWQVWLAPNGSEFVTSDNPVITFIRFGDVWHPGHGFNRPGVVVAFPLASTACLIAGIAGTEYQKVDVATVKRINELVVSCSDRFVYSRTRSAEIVMMVNQLAHTSVPGKTAFVGQMPDAAKVEEYMRNYFGMPKRKAS